MSLSESLLHLYFSIILLGYAISILGQLFVSDKGFPIFGVAAFFLMFLAAWIGQSKQKALPTTPSRIWWVLGPICVVSFVTTIFLTGGYGSPVSDGLPILAARPQYNFTRAKGVEAWRYLIASASFCIGWNSFGIGFAIGLWRYWTARIRQRAR